MEDTVPHIALLLMLLTCILFLVGSVQLVGETIHNIAALFESDSRNELCHFLLQEVKYQLPDTLANATSKDCINFVFTHSWHLLCILTWIASLMILRWQDRRQQATKVVSILKEFDIFPLLPFDQTNSSLARGRSHMSRKQANSHRREIEKVQLQAQDAIKDADSWQTGYCDVQEKYTILWNKQQELFQSCDYWAMRDLTFQNERLRDRLSSLKKSQSDDRELQIRQLEDRLEQQTCRESKILQEISSKDVKIDLLEGKTNANSSTIRDLQASLSDLLEQKQRDAEQVSRQNGQIERLEVKIRDYKNADALHSHQRVSEEEQEEKKIGLQKRINSAENAVIEHERLRKQLEDCLNAAAMTIVEHEGLKRELEDQLSTANTTTTDLISREEALKAERVRLQTLCSSAQTQLITAHTDIYIANSRADNLQQSLNNLAADAEKLHQVRMNSELSTANEMLELTRKAYERQLGEQNAALIRQNETIETLRAEVGQLTGNLEYINSTTDALLCGLAEANDQVEQQFEQLKTADNTEKELRQQVEAYEEAAKRREADLDKEVKIEIDRLAAMVKLAHEKNLKDEKALRESESLLQQREVKVNKRIETLNQRAERLTNPEHVQWDAAIEEAEGTVRSARQMFYRSQKVADQHERLRASLARLPQEFKELKSGAEIKAILADQTEAKDLKLWLLKLQQILGGPTGRTEASPDNASSPSLPEPSTAMAQHGNENSKRTAGEEVGDGAGSQEKRLRRIL